MKFLSELKEYILNNNQIVDLELVQQSLKSDEFVKLHEEFRNTEKWMSYERKISLIKDLSDSHLINIIGHCFYFTHYGERFHYSLVFEFFYRGLNLEQLKQFQIPHINMNGDSVIMSYDSKSLYQTVKVS